MTFNIVHTLFTDVQEHPYVKPWAERRNSIYQIITDVDPDILGLQEDSAEQRGNIDTRFSAYDYIDSLPDVPGGAHNSIFYKRSKFSLLDSGNFRVTSLSPRRATWAKFLDISSQQEFIVYNTHWNPGDELLNARLESAQTIAQNIASQSPEIPVILVGDLNSLPDRQPVQYLVSPANTFSDMTYPTNFRVLVDHSPENRECVNNSCVLSGSFYIDYIITSPDLRSRNYLLYNYNTMPGYVASDHDAIAATILISQNNIVPIIQTILLDED